MCLFCQTNVQAQTPATSKNTEDIWGIIEPQLNQFSSDTSFQLVSLVVKGNCGQDFDCLYENYKYAKEKLERKFDLPAAILVCEEMVKLAEKAGEKDEEAYAHVDLHRFLGALGKHNEAIAHVDEAEQLFLSTDNQKALIHLRINKLEESFAHREASEVLSDMEALLEKAIEIGDTTNQRILHIYLIVNSLAYDMYETTERHIRHLEETEITEPYSQAEYTRLIYASFGRAELAKARGNWEEAIGHYLVCLQWCEDQPSRWMEIRTMHNLAEMEMELGNMEDAHSYLDGAEMKSKKLELDDQLAYTYQLKARLAEEEERFEEALAFSKKQQNHEEKFDSRGAGFDYQKHELAKEKERLAAEAARKEAELKKKDSLIKTLIAIGLVLVALTTFVLVRRNRKKQAENQTIAQISLIGKNEKQPLSEEDERDKPGPTLPEPDRMWLNGFNEYIRKNLSDERMTVPMVAMDFAMSESSLLRQVKRLTGMSPAKYIQEMRLEKGKELLEKKRFDSVARVASEVGYGDSRSFSRVFKKRFGKLPSDFINN